MQILDFVYWVEATLGRSIEDGEGKQRAGKHNFIEKAVLFIFVPFWGVKLLEIPHSPLTLTGSHRGLLIC